MQWIDFSREREVLCYSAVFTNVHSSAFHQTVNEGSGETNQKETSTCDICQFGAECDEDAEDVWYSNLLYSSILMNVVLFKGTVV